MSKALEGEHYCIKHQGNHSHYAEENCTVCKLQHQRDELLVAPKEAEPTAWLVVDKFDSSFREVVFSKDAEVIQQFHSPVFTPLSPIASQVQQPIAEVMSLFPLMGIAHIQVKMQNGVSPVKVGDALYIDPVTSQAIKKE